MRLASLWRNVIHRDRVETDLDDEIAYGLRPCSWIDKSRGASPDDAKRAARLEIGGIDQVKERVRDAAAWGHG